MTEYKSIKANVEIVLEEVPEARNSDNVLLLHYWARFDDRIFSKIIDIMGNNAISFHLTNFDTIRRLRQQIQNDNGKFKPDPDVKRARLEKQAKMQREFKRD